MLIRCKTLLSSCLLALLMFNAIGNAYCNHGINVVEKKVEERLIFSMSEDWCSISIEFANRGKVSGHYESLFIRNNCSSSASQFIEHLSTLLKKANGDHNVLKNIEGVFLGHFSRRQSAQLALYAYSSPTWLSFLEKNNTRGLNKAVLELIKESNVMSELKAAFGHYGITIRERSIEKVSTSSFKALTKEKWVKSTIGSKSSNNDVKVPYQGMMWFSKVSN